MKILNLFSFLRWTMVWTATWTMMVSPLAMGQEANRVTKQQMQMIMDQLGLNKQITLGEFYKKNKHLYPERIQKEIEPLFTNFKNQLMPTFEVISSKSTSGDEIATIRVLQGSELLNIQWFGEKERMLKFQNTNLSEIDVINFGDMFTRVIAGDEKFRKQIEKNSNRNSTKVLNNFSAALKYPDVTKAEWKSMSSQNKANYIVNLRSLWQDARQVLKEKNSVKKNKKTSLNSSDKNKNLYSLIIGAEVEAAAKTVATGEKSANYFSGETCIVAGYVAKYEKTSSGEVCDYKVIDQVYNHKDNSLYKKANDICSTSNQIACNPYVFGTPNGAPTCVTPALKNVSFQKATHWDGPCDTASRLQTSQNEIEILKEKKSQGRYEDGNLKSEEERNEIFKKEQGENFKLTEDYLLGMLKFRGLVKADVKSIFDSGVLSDQIYNQIILDKQGFDNEIAEAQKSCKAESVAGKNAPRVHEKNYWPACDQLQRRFTFIHELFESKCEGTRFNSDTLKCGCGASSAPAPVAAVNPIPQTAADTAPVSAPVPPRTRFPFPVTPAPEVVPGASCAVVLPPAIEPASVDASKPVVEAEDCEAKYPGAEVSGSKCLCANGGVPKKDVTDIASGSEAWSCAAPKNAKADKKDDCGIICKIFSGIKKYALPVLLTGAVVFAAYKGLQMLAPKKPALNPPPDKCLDGSIPPCGQVCKVPLKMQADGSCSCDGCPPGQTANTSTCVCTTGTTTSTQTYLCPDSTTRVADLANCPTYPCWNGQSYQNTLNCPPATPVVPASSGTSN